MGITPPEFEMVIGLEVHAQLLTGTKLFCPCPNRFSAPPNSLTCPVCLGYPGTLPVLRFPAVELLLKTALATHCQVRELSIFARKNYFYPDLPKGYQITQFELPLAENGHIMVPNDNGGGEKPIRIRRIHLEEDTGKLSHDGHSGSRLDLNRAGVPLMEIVTEPDIRSPAEAVKYLTSLHAIIRHLGVCDGNLEEGSMRCEPNISIRPRGYTHFGTKVEVKNLNSFRSVERGIAHEFQRQKAILREGGTVRQETRGWDEKRGETYLLRRKEDAHDYRYFPEPDLPPLRITAEFLDGLRSKLGELPRAKGERFQREFGLSPYDSEVLTHDPETASYFEELLRSGVKNPKTAANWVLNNVLAKARELKVSLDRFPIPPPALTELLDFIDRGELSATMGKEVFEEMALGNLHAADIIQNRGLRQESDTTTLETIIREVLSRESDSLEKYFAGKEKLLGFLVGQIMKATKGKANPTLVNKILPKVLDEIRKMR